MIRTLPAWSQKNQDRACKEFLMHFKGCKLETCRDFNWKVCLLNPLAATQGHLSCGGVTAEKITVNPMSQTVIPKGILSVLQSLPSPHKTQSLLALAAPRLWQIWFEKAGNKNEHRHSSLPRPRWEDGAALCAIWSTSRGKWIKKIHWFSPSFCSHITLAQSINLPKCVWTSTVTGCLPPLSIL